MWKHLKVVERKFFSELLHHRPSWTKYQNYSSQFHIYLTYKPGENIFFILLPTFRILDHTFTFSTSCWLKCKMDCLLIRIKCWIEDTSGGWANEGDFFSFRYHKRTVDGWSNWKLIWEVFNPSLLLHFKRPGSKEVRVFGEKMFKVMNLVEIPAQFDD